jgi:predicted HAD superfamily Cof-like phosphohydrolase
MLICIEGPDASGKSTLAQYLARALALPVQSSEGPPQYPGEMTRRLQRYADTLPNDIIFDRHPCVSDLIYASAFGRPPGVSPIDVAEFYGRNPIFIYCVPVEGRCDPHIAKTHDTIEHLANLKINHDKVIQGYFAWAQRHASFIYRIGDRMDKILHYLTDFVGDIEDFHKKFDITYRGPPRYLPEDLLHFRLKFMAEELCEYASVLDVTKSLIQAALIEKSDARLTLLHDEFDALIDLVYVAIGTSHLQGFKFREGWARVHRANMAKRRATSSTDSTRGHIADVVKPEGWTPPSLTDLVREA